MKYQKTGGNADMFIIAIAMSRVVLESRAHGLSRPGGGPEADERAEVQGR